MNSKTWKLELWLEIAEVLVISKNMCENVKRYF